MEPGKNTSEFSLTKWVIIIGTVLDLAGIVLEALKEQVHAGWFPTVLVVVGTLMALVKALGYTRSRTMLKLADLAPVIAPEVAAAIPLFVALAKELKSGSQQLPLPGVLPTPPLP